MERTTWVKAFAAHASPTSAEVASRKSPCLSRGTISIQRRNKRDKINRDSECAQQEGDHNLGNLHLARLRKGKLGRGAGVFDKGKGNV